METSYSIRSSPSGKVSVGSMSGSVIAPAVETGATETCSAGSGSSWSCSYCAGGDAAGGAAEGAACCPGAGSSEPLAPRRGNHRVVAERAVVETLQTSEGL